jgi:hypothetical protein
MATAPSTARLESLCTDATSEVVFLERFFGWPHNCVLRPYHAQPGRSGGVVIQEGHGGSSSAPPRVKEAEVKEEMPAQEEDERP